MVTRHILTHTVRSLKGEITIYSTGAYHYLLVHTKLN